MRTAERGPEGGPGSGPEGKSGATFERDKGVFGL